MKVLMLGWEYPPHISGGLGTACEGLTLGLNRQKTEILFVIPRRFGDEQANHMTLVGTRGTDISVLGADGGGQITAVETQKIIAELRKKTKITSIPSTLSPYLTPSSYQDVLTQLRLLKDRGLMRQKGFSIEEDEPETFEQYGGDIFEEVDRYARKVATLFADESFDVIHAHDWMTFPAGILLSELTGKPLIVQVHSLERDRSGNSTNPRIDEIERWGTQRAHAVIAVSYYTKNLIASQHKVPQEKIYVVHNGVYQSQVVQSYKKNQVRDSKLVLFLGRVTFQKGPDYFVEAAAKVVPVVPNVLFVMAGSGDMLAPMMRKVSELGITKNFFFPGFLRGQEVEQMFSLADVYVMPSVSEPFGISALEAISHETPVIISKQSGVSEVLSHALKVDFWDVNKLADLIVNTLLHKELRQDIVSMAKEELKRLHWDAAAKKVNDVYRKVIAG
jgi:glycosyltransferase involved in cell wall biosynthesis